MDIPICALVVPLLCASLAMWRLLVRYRRLRAGQAAVDLAVATQRRQVARALHAVVGQQLAGIAAKAAAARLTLNHDAAGARAQMVSAGVTAREAIARARAVTAGEQGLPGQRTVARRLTS